MLATGKNPVDLGALGGKPLIPFSSGVPSHGRGRRFNPYSAHQQNSQYSKRLRANGANPPTAVRGGTRHEHGATRRKKVVDFVPASFRPGGAP
jgi:hypothetical protein